MNTYIHTLSSNHELKRTESPMTSIPMQSMSLNQASPGRGGIEKDDDDDGAADVEAFPEIRSSLHLPLPLPSSSSSLSLFLLKRENI